MSTAALILGSAALLAGCSGVEPNETGSATRPAAQLQCPDTGYDGFTFPEETRIPDGDPAGLRIGPLPVLDDGRPVEGVMVAVTISHDYVGDVELRLLYDEDSDGREEASSPLEFFRARLDGCAGPELRAYPIVLDGTYYFRSETSEATNGERQLGTFDGFRKGGDFYLAVADSGAGNAGVVSSWTLFVPHAEPNGEPGVTHGH